MIIDTTLHYRYLASQIYMKFQECVKEFRSLCEWIYIASKFDSFQDFRTFAQPFRMSK